MQATVITRGSEKIVHGREYRIRMRQNEKDKEVYKDHRDAEPIGTGNNIDR